MLLLEVIAALRERVPVFAGRVGGAAEFENLEETGKLPVPAAYVMPLDEKAEAQLDQTGYEQEVVEGFAVVVVLSNVPDERGQDAVATLPAIRAALFAALLGWDPTGYDAIEYQGATLLQMNRGRLYYQYEFKTSYWIGQAQTWYQVRNDALPGFEGMTINTDVIAPIADPNLHYPGPDGRIEFSQVLTLPQS